MNQVYLNDVLEGLREIPDNSADIVLIDPPYNIGKDFGTTKDKMDLESYLKWSDEWMHESIRILNESGTIYVYGFSEILSHISVRIDLPLRWLIWHYTNKNSPLLKFWQRSYESIVVAWKDPSKRLFNLDDVREPYSDVFLKNAAGKVRKGTKGRFQSSEQETIYQAHENGALPRDVLKVPALAGGAGAVERFFLCKTCDNIFINKEILDHKEHEIVQHPTQKPKELTKRLFLASKPKEEGFVVVPFAGTGSELKVAKELGMTFIGFDNNPDYVKMANYYLR